jgi:hypothetical protein
MTNEHKRERVVSGSPVTEVTPTTPEFETRPALGTPPLLV